jgi:hypothetical protein
MRIVLGADVDDTVTPGACALPGTANPKGAPVNIRKDVRPSDYLLTAVMVALAVLLALMNMTVSQDAGFAQPLESRSPLMIPVFALAALPILWRRRHVLVALGVSVAVLSASVPMFGWVTRCGFALPLSLAFAYAVARFAGPGRGQVLGLLGVLVMQVVTLVRDASTGGLGALTISVPVAAIAYGAGVLVQRRVTARTSTPTLSTQQVNA